MCLGELLHERLLDAVYNTGQEGGGPNRHQNIQNNKHLLTPACILPYLHLYIKDHMHFYVSM